MPHKYIKLLALVGITVLMLSACSSKKKTVTSSLKDTVISPHMEVKLEKDKNAIYCSTFQIAWNELKDQIVKEDIKLSKEQGLANILNKSLGGKEDLSQQDYVAKAGYAKDDIVKNINSEIKRKFGNTIEPIDEKFNRDDDIFAYALLYKNLEFENKFEKIKDPLDFNGSSVKSFGVDKLEGEKRYKVAKQVSIIDYKRDEDFILRLAPKGDKDEIIIAKVQGKEDMLKTIEAVKVRIKSGKVESLGEKDRMIIPSFDFNVSHQYDELINKSFLNKGFEDYTIVKALQSIDFTLNEEGAKVKSEAKLGATKSAPNIDDKPKHLIVDKPFLLMLQEKDSKYPYLALWVENVELLVKD